MPPARLKTYIRGMDETLEGGIPRGHAVLVTGAPGTMKSSLAFSILYENALQEGARGLYLTLEQSRRSLQAHLQAMGMADEAAFERISLFDLAALRKHIPALQAEGSWITLLRSFMENFRESDGYDLAVVDSLNVLESLGAFGDRRTDLFRFFEWVRDLGPTTFLISESAAEGSHAPPGADEAYLADGILQLSLYGVSDIDVQRRIRCVKMRTTRHEMGAFALVWNGSTFEITRAVSAGRAKPETV